MHRTLQLALPFALSLASVALCQNPYGLGTPGSGGFTPRLSSPQAWMGNAGFGFRIDAGLGGAPAVVALSAGRTFLPLGGLDVLVDPLNLFVTVPGALGGSPGVAGTGTAFVPFSTGAPHPAFAGFPFWSQAFVIDPGAPLGIAASQGWRAELVLPPLIFVGCSIASGDPYQLIDPLTGAIVASGSPAATNNVTAAVFADGGRRLYVASSIANTVSLGDVSTLPVTWNSSWYVSAGAGCYGLAHDPHRDLLWTLTDPGVGTRELVALDANPASPTYGVPVHQTSSVASGIFERWCLSSSGRFAAVLGLLPSTLTIVDTDPSSPTFLQNLTPFPQPVPINQPSAIDIATQVVITPDDRYALVVIQLAGATPGEIARFDMQTGQWVDHDAALPGTQNLGPFSTPPVALGSAPTSITLSNAGDFAIVGGFGQCGWLGRLDLDPLVPTNFGWTSYAPMASTSNSWAVTLSNDESEVAWGTWPQSGCTGPTTPELVRMDVQTGNVLSVTPIPFNSNSRTLQNLYTVTYR